MINLPERYVRYVALGHLFKYLTRMLVGGLILEVDEQDLNPSLAEDLTHLDNHDRTFLQI